MVAAYVVAELAKEVPGLMSAMQVRCIAGMGGCGSGWVVMRSSCQPCRMGGCCPGWVFERHSIGYWVGVASECLDPGSLPHFPSFR